MARARAVVWASASRSLCSLGFGRSLALGHDGVGLFLGVSHQLLLFLLGLLLVGFAAGSGFGVHIAQLILCAGQGCGGILLGGFRRGNGVVDLLLALCNDVHDRLVQELPQQQEQDQNVDDRPQKIQIQCQHSVMPPLSTQEQDDQQGNDEAENCSTFCQSSAQQEVGLDLTGSFRLAADGLRCLTGGNADADAAANTSQRCDTSAQSYESVHNKISFVM